MRSLLTSIILLTCCATMSAQRIDINNSSNRTDDGYTGWTFANTTRATTTVDGITFILGIEASAGRTLKCEWWKDGVNKYSKLTSDGVGVYGLDGNNNTPQIQSGPVGMTLTLMGLSEGRHSLLAYHNNPSGYSGPKIDVYVDGVLALTGVEQTNRAQQPSQSGMSYVSFDATQGQPVNIIFRTTPDPDFDYTQGYNTTSLFVNALVLDRPNPKTTASDPWPEHLDEHADCDGNGNGQVELRWTAASSAVRHHVFLGTQPDALRLLGVSTTATCKADGLSPEFTYYWRVDEEDAEGNVYQGDTWSFRPRRLAFPDAEGYGRFAIGGRGGTVYHVTSLDDDVDNPQPGTFRYGITKATGPRTIVFDVAGVIHLKGRLTCQDKYVTVAGQTAPAQGIMLRGAPFGMQSDGITRFLRMRRGHITDEADANRGLDGLGMAGNDHAIMDHCSISWTIDEGFSSRGAKNITLQRTLISEALNIAGHPNYPAGTAHGYAATIGGGENGGLGSSFHHNLLAHNEGRNWSMSGGLDGQGNYDGHHDMFNNVVYNWGGRATDGGTHEGQFVGNYYKMGPATTKKIILEATLEGPHPGTQSYYVSGNLRQNLDGSTTTDKEGDTYQKNVKATHSQQWEVFVSQPFFPSYATVQTAQQAWHDVLSDVGCNQPVLDVHDSRMVSETLSGTTSTVGSKSKKKGLIDHEDDAEGFNGLNISYAVRPAGWDTDQDGIPDWYERLSDTDPATPNNNNYGGNGYTDLENYLEWLAHPHFVVNTDTLFTIDLRPYFAGFGTDFEIIDNGEQTDDGVSYYYKDQQMQVVSMWPKLRVQSVTVRHRQTGATMTRRFCIAFTNDKTAAIGPDVEGNMPYTSPTAKPQAYDLSGRPYTTYTPKGVYVQGGVKRLSK